MLIIFLALICANAPFYSRRRFGFWRPQNKLPVLAPRVADSDLQPASPERLLPSDSKANEPQDDRFVLANQDSLPAVFDKPKIIALAEWLIGYSVFLLIALALEANSGAIYQKIWQFYVLTLGMFALLAFPGFVWRYLYRA